MHYLGPKPGLKHHSIASEADGGDAFTRAQQHAQVVS
jgi:hypothetical protein